MSFNIMPSIWVSQNVFERLIELKEKFRATSPNKLLDWLLEDWQIKWEHYEGDCKNDNS